MKRVALLGATGSIGRQALQIIQAYPDRFSIQSLSANRQVKQLAEAARVFRPEKVAVGDPACYNELRSECIGLSINVLAGPDALAELAADEKADIVLNALVGFAGLRPTLAAVAAGKTVALANKESLVAGGHLVMPGIRAGKAQLLPVDSEHSAIFQCLQGQQRDAVARIILTASGGPFFGKTRDALSAVTPQMALKHPNWDMGAKITIDSATLVNKGLEVMEAHWLFELPYHQIDVVIHRESIIHSLVEFADGAVLAQLGAPDMGVPIQYALTYPERLHGNAPRIDWNSIGRLHFAPPDRVSFPALELAYKAGEAGGSAPAVLNAANEEAVRLFLGGKIGFLDITRIIESVLNKHKVVSAPDFATLTEIDAEAREMACECAGMKG